MTLATDIATLGTYDSTDITNMVIQGLDLISVYFGSTYTENADEDWDRIAKIQIIWLLDRMALQRRAIGDHTIVVPPLISPEIHTLIKRLQTEQFDQPLNFSIATFNDTDLYGEFHNDPQDFA